MSLLSIYSVIDYSLTTCHFINIRLLEQCRSTLHTWFSFNGLALNPDISEVILIGTASLSPLVTINVAGGHVSISTQAKLHVVTLDCSLSLDKRIYNISKPCFSTCLVFATYAPMSPMTQQKIIASSLVAQRLDYANAMRVGMSSKYQYTPTYAKHTGADRQQRTSILKIGRR